MTTSPELSVLETPPGHIDCKHCGLPLPRSRRSRGAEFCCSGCERVHALIRESGLERYYDLRRGPGLPPSAPGSGDYAWLGPLTEGAPGSACRIDLDVQGIHCTGCVWLLNTLFARHPGGSDLRINPALGRAEIIWDFGREDLRHWLRDVESFGYRLGPPRKTADRSPSHALFIRLGITAALAMNVMVFSFCYYLGLGRDNPALYRLFGQLSLVLAGAAVLVGGDMFFRGAVRGLRRGIAHLDLPIATGLLLGYSGSVLAFLRHGPEAAYFDTVAIFATLMLTGRWLQERILERNRHALLADAGTDHLTARRVREGELQFVSYQELEPGDEVWVVPGDVVPVAGILIGEPATVRLDWITGESDLHTIGPGEDLTSGAIHAGDSMLRMVVRERFEVSRLYRLLVRPAAPMRAPTAGFWRAFGAVYVAAVFLLAAVGLGVWWSHGVDKAVSVATAILVITCPCALGLAWPLANELAHLALRRRGVFIRNGDFFERARSVRKIVFDKTGTLTLSDPALAAHSRRHLEALRPADRTVLRNMVARSNHPLSRALARAIPPESAPLDVTLQVRELAGIGLEAESGSHAYRLGRRASTAPSNGAFSEAVFSIDGRDIATFHFEEALREDAREELAGLGRAGYAVYLLSGDAPVRVMKAAERLGIPADHAWGRLSPEDKAAWLRDHDRRDTLMVGDGLNDGPAFDAAFATATPAIEHPAMPGRADFYFLGEDVAAVRRALATAVRLRRVIRGNLAFALGYNALALGLAFSGRVTPLVAAVLMPASSALVIYLTLLRMRPGTSSWMS